jgi:hypothetical protein
MPWIEIALPGLLMFAKFLVKLVVGRSASLPDFVSAILALPVDIIFLSASLLAGYVISSPKNSKEGLILFMACICLSIIIVLLWRKSEGQFTKDKYISAISCGLLNMGMATATLVFSLSLLTSGANQ